MIRADELESIEQVINATLPDVSINDRTSATVACRITSMKTRRVRIEGVPHAAHPPEWKLKFPDESDVRGGDTLTVAGKGTYKALVVTSPTSISTSTVAYCVQETEPDGSIAIFTNYTVQFRSINNDKLLPAPIKVFISEVTQDIRLALSLDPALRWSVLFDNRQQYVGSAPGKGYIGSGDKIIWDRFGVSVPGGNALQQAISPPRPRPEFPMLSLAFFKEQA